MRQSLALALVVLTGCVTPTQTRTDRTVAQSKPALATPAPTVAEVTPGRFGPLSDDDICVRPLDHVVRGLDGAKPFAPAEPTCSEDNPFCDAADTPPDPTDLCFVANQNIARAERESRKAVAAKVQSDPWDGVKPPRYLDRIDAHLHLTSTEHEVLRKNGFVVLDRLPYVSYANAFHDVFQEQLPLWVGVDPILHAVFRGTEAALERVERKRLVPALSSLLRKLRIALSQSRGRYDAETLADLDVYLGVASALGASPDAKQHTLFGNDAEVSALVSHAAGGALLPVEMFGRERMVDFSQLEPRGHYASHDPSLPSLVGYFQSVMWLSRLEFNLVSRSCRSSHPGALPDPSETPREARAALALADLVRRSGAASELGAFEQVYAAFAGRREDVSPLELARLMRVHGISPKGQESFDKLEKAIGDRYHRTARTHFMPEGAKELPAIATLLGPRIVPDVAPLTRLVHDAVPDRVVLGAADVAYVLGHDRAKAYLDPDLQAYPDLPAALDDARAQLNQQVNQGHDVYTSWLRAVASLGPEPKGVVPSFMRREAYADHRMNSAIVGYGQIRHAYVLLGAQGYDAYGCEIPDAYVEPLPEVFDALVAHVRRMRTQAQGWAGLERVLTVLASIARAEADGRPLTDSQRRWLAMVAENVPAGGYCDSGAPPKWTGWYFDMFDDREHGASRGAAFIADYFTLTNAGQVAYLGAEGPRLAVYVVDVGGEPRAMVGPVAKGYEARSPIESRLSDDQARSWKHEPAVWRSFAPSLREEPRLGLEGRVVRCEKDGVASFRVALRSDTPVDTVRVTLLDHHADPVTPPLEARAGDAWRVYGFELPPAVTESPYGVEAIHVRIPDLAPTGTGAESWDYFTGPSVFRGGGADEEGLPVRPRGVGAFAVGAARP
jgi:hypothetical protein